MADDTELNAGAGGDKVRSKQRGGASGPKTNVVLLDLQDGSGNETLVNGKVPVSAAVGANDLLKAEDAAHGSGDAGVMALFVRSAAPTDRSAGPTDGDYEPGAVNEVGAQWVTQAPSANGGASVLNSTSSDGGTALTATAQAIKASAGTLRGWYIYNPNTAAVFVQFYNAGTGSVTVGTTAPLFMITVPPGSATNVAWPDGIQFSTAITWAATSTAAGAGAPSTALDAVAFYK